MMNMNEILMEMKKNYETMAPGLALAEAKVAAFEKEVAEANEKLAKDSNELRSVKDQLDAMKMSIETLEMGGFVAHIDGKSVEVKKAEPKKVSAKLEWKHQNAFVLMMNEFDNVIDRFRTQGAAAKKLKISQATVSYWMRRSKENQLKKLGYYLAWEY